MLKRLVTTFALFLVTVVGGAGSGLLQGHAGAAAPTATLGTGPGTYTVDVTADAGTFRISLGTTRDPVTSGGCVDNFVRTRRGHTVNGVTCTSAGTIQFSTSLYVACETPLDLTLNGVVVQSWLLNAPCPPPLPPAVVATYGDGIASFDNTAASVDQIAVFHVGLPDGTTSCDTASTDPVWAGARITTHFAGIGLNRYTYLTLDGVDYVHVPAGAVAFVAWSCA